MTVKESDLLPELSPPAGGLVRLRARRDADERLFEWLQTVIAVLGLNRRGWQQYLPLAAGTCAVLLILLRVPDELPSVLAADRLIGACSDGQTLQLQDDAAAAQAQSSSQAGVRLYWIESLSVAPVSEPVSDSAI